MDELVDIVDASDHVLGTKRKSEAIKNKDLTRVCFVILVSARNELFLQQRKATKKTYPLFWSGSAAGHVRSGESYYDAARRELFEELGVKTELEEVSKFTSDVDREITTVFLGRSDGPYTLEDASIETVEYFSLTQLRAAGTNMKMTDYLTAALPLVDKYLESKPA